MTTKPITAARAPQLVSLRGDEVRTFPALHLRATRADDGDDGDGDGGDGGDGGGSSSGRFTELEGMAVPYNTWTDTGWEYEQFAPGAFAKSISENPRLPLLLWHDNRTWPVGASREWDERDDGLWGAPWELDESEEAQRGADLADKGMLTGMSIGFVPSRRDEANEWVNVETGEPLDEDDWWNPMAGVIRHEARLVEVSLTPTPAYAGAQVALVRSAERHQTRQRRRGAEEIAGWRRYLEGIRRA